jgi:tetrapyrrole methylase family protein/MazG family protein
MRSDGASEEGNYMSSFDELVDIMELLRSEKGCPWDREQTHESIKPYLIEEAYEVLSAIDEHDDEGLKAELGDLLLQVTFHAQIAKEGDRFDIEDVIRTNIEKLKRRHPHVFGEVTVNGTGQVLENWEKIKVEERKEGKTASVLDGVPKDLPALLRAQRVQEKASTVGFDWERTEDVMRKVDEEFHELKEACRSEDPERISDEIGDFLFSLVNLSRFLGVWTEEALRGTLDKFEKRFKFIESELAKSGRSPMDSTLQEMDALWEKAKEFE